ncbi:hypothetical protein D9757_000868 [Collybiopsis confluens]|uniref:NAD(P)-binding domain-containing protein n=1 Tax=Collybiopsis confluens TaxID=2823264 RepID=A0A8H5I0F1_9AGAR|nr:hypothetical protein D9757_000868 [Collybiopsis confluens]
MQITIFGGTGPSGKALIQETLRRNHTIVLFARSPHKLDPEFRDSDRINVVQGTLDSYPSILSSLRGSSCALILLASTDGMPHWVGGTSSSLTITNAYRNIINAMSELGIKRLIGTGTPSHVEPLDGLNLALFLGVSLLKVLLPKVYEDVVETGKLLTSLGEGGVDGASKEESDIDWTWIRVPNLYDGPSKQKYKLGYVGQGGWFLLPRLSREELAKAILDEMYQGNWVKGIPFCCD